MAFLIAILCLLSPPVPPQVNDVADRFNRAMGCSGKAR